MGTKRELNNKDLGLELEINDDLRLSNRGLMKKSDSLYEYLLSVPRWSLVPS